MNDSEFSEAGDNPIKIFREEYEKLEEVIKDKAKQKSKISRQIREICLEIDQHKRTLSSRQAKVSEKEKLLRTRQSNVTDVGLDQTSEKAAYEKAQQRQATLRGKIDKMRKELEKARILIENEDAKLREIRPSLVDYHLIETNINYISQRVESRKKILNQKMEEWNAAKQQLKQLSKDEQELSAQKVMLENKFDEFEDRRAETLRVLSEPIDNLQYEEQIVADAEKDAEETEKRQLNFQNEDGYLKNQQILEEIAEQERANEQRRLSLEQRKQIVEAETKNYQKVALASPTKSPDTPRKINAEQLKTESARELMEKITRELNEKLAKVSKEEEEIDKIEQKYQSERKQIEGEYRGKKEQMKLLSDQIRRLETLMINISELNSQIDDLENESLDNQSKIGQLKRRNKNAERDKSRNAEFRSKIDEIRKGISDKENARQQMDLQIEEMRRTIPKHEEEIEQIRQELTKQSEAAEIVRAQVKEAASKVESITAQIEEQQAALSKFLEEHPTTANDQNTMSALLQLAVNPKNQ